MGRYKLIDIIGHIQVTPRRYTYQDHGRSNSLYHIMINTAGHPRFLNLNYVSQRSLIYDFRKMYFDKSLYLINKDYYFPVMLSHVTEVIGYQVSMWLNHYSVFDDIIKANQDLSFSLYYDSGEICRSCLSLMRDFNECAPIIKTKIGSLIL